MQLVQGEVVLLKAEMARRDSARAAQLEQIIQVQRQIMDSLNATRRSVAQVRGDLSTDLYNIQQQLVQLQELTGQSQQRLTELRTRLEARGAQMERRPFRATPRGPRRRRHRVGGPDVRGVAGAAPARKSLHRPPWLAGDAAPVPHQRAGPGRALFHRPELRVGESRFRGRLLQQVMEKYPASPRAASALYNLGLLAERRKDTKKARDAYQRVDAAVPAVRRSRPGS